MIQFFSFPSSLFQVDILFSFDHIQMYPKMMVQMLKINISAMKYVKS